MKNISYKRIDDTLECLSSLGQIKSRALFGGYSLAVEGTVFAMVADGELYLRACEQSATWRVKHPTPLLTLVKRGRPILLNYYHVDDSLWYDKQALLQLSSHSLQEARREKQHRCVKHKLRDLPNITFHLEILLMDVGIMNEEHLRTLGAEASWLRIREQKKHLSVNVLFTLEGAIVGLHAAALPAQRRQELCEWACTLSEKYPSIQTQALSVAEDGRFRATE